MGREKCPSDSACERERNHAGKPPLEGGPPGRGRTGRVRATFICKSFATIALGHESSLRQIGSDHLCLSILPQCVRTRPWLLHRCVTVKTARRCRGGNSDEVNCGSSASRKAGYFIDAFKIFLGQNLLPKRFCLLPFDVRTLARLLCLSWFRSLCCRSLSACYT